MAFKLKSQGSSFKMMGASPVKLDKVKNVAKVGGKILDKVFSLPALIAYDALTSEATYKDYPKGDYRRKYAQAGQELSAKDKIVKSTYDNTIGLIPLVADIVGETTGLYDIPDKYSELEITPQPQIRETTSFKKPREKSVEGYTGGYPASFGGWSPH